MYADDCTFLFHNRCSSLLRHTMEKTLLSINNWLISNKLILNCTKSNIVNFSTRVANSQDFQITVGDDVISTVPSTRFLGISIDITLNWRVHIDKLCNQLSSTCFALRQLAGTVTESALTDVYRSLIESRIRYGILCWGASTELDRVLKLQKRAVRIILQKTWRHPCRELFKKLKILTAPSLFILSVCTFIKTHQYQFIKNDEVHSHSTRGSSRLHVPRANLTMTRKNLPYVAIHIYNSLPESLKNISGTNEFKNCLKEFLTDACYYSIDDYLDQ